MTTNQEPDIIHQPPRRHQFSRKETFGYGIAALNLVASLIQIGTFVFSSTHPETQQRGSASNSFFTTTVSATLAASLFMSWLALFWFAVRVATLKRLNGAGDVNFAYYYNYVVDIVGRLSLIPTAFFAFIWSVWTFGLNGMTLLTLLSVLFLWSWVEKLVLYGMPVFTADINPYQEEICREAARREKIFKECSENNKGSDQSN